MSATSVAVSIGPSSLMAIDAIGWSPRISQLSYGSGPSGAPRWTPACCVAERMSEGWHAPSRTLDYPPVPPGAVVHPIRDRAADSPIMSAGSIRAAVPIIVLAMGSVLVATAAVGLVETALS